MPVMEFSPQSEMLLKYRHGLSIHTGERAMRFSTPHHGLPSASVTLFQGMIFMGDVSSDWGNDWGRKSAGENKGFISTA